MKRIFTAWMLLWQFAIVCTAQTDMRQMFTLMPDSLTPYLTGMNRQTLMELYEAGAKAEITNLLGGTTCLQGMSEDSLSIRQSEASQIDVLLLQSPDSIDGQPQVIACMRTYHLSTGELDSVLTFYSAYWRPLPQCPALLSQSAKRLGQWHTHSNLHKRDEDIFSKQEITLKTEKQ